MRRLLTVLIIAISSAAPPSAADAGAPAGDTFTYTRTDVDVSFCGIGPGHVRLSESYSGRDRVSPNGSGDVATVARGTRIWTSQEATVIEHFAQHVTIVAVSGDPQDLHVVDFRNVGSQQLRLGHGGVLEMIAGSITFRYTFDGEELVSEEVVSTGQHPEIDSGYTSFCTVMRDALGF